MSNQQTKRNLAVLLIAAAVLVAGVTVAGWAKKPVKPPAAARFTQVYIGIGPNGINEAGLVAGVWTTADGNYHAFLLTPGKDEAGKQVWFLDSDDNDINDLIIDLGTLPGHRESGAYSVNDSGQVAGYSVYMDGGWEPHAFIITPEYDDDGNPVVWFRDDDNGGNALMIDLGTIGGDGSWSLANGINGAGEVVGQATSDEQAESGYFYRHAFLWQDLNGDGVSDDGEMIDLGTLGGPESEAHFINDSGQVVGRADTSETDSEGRVIQHAFLIVPEYDDEGNPVVWFRDNAPEDGVNDLMIDLGTLGGLRSWARAINDSGQIVGTAQGNGDTNRAFLLTPEDVDDDGNLDWFSDDGSGGNALMTDLGTLKSLNAGSAGDLNNAGQVVGYSSQSSSAGHGRPGPGGGNKAAKVFLWEDGQMKDLDDLTDSDIDIGGPNHINNKGQIVTAGNYILLPIPPADAP